MRGTEKVRRNSLVERIGVKGAHVLQVQEFNSKTEADLVRLAKLCERQKTTMDIDLLILWGFPLMGVPPNGWFISGKIQLK